MTTRCAAWRRRAWAPAIVAAAIWTGCTTPPPTPGAAEKAGAAFRETLAGTQTEGRRQANDVLAVYAQIPAEAAPGVTQLRHEILDAREALKAAGRENLSPDEVEALTLRNPAFWQAWFEFGPRDVSLLVLHSSLLAESGQLLRASVVLTIGVQAAPLNATERTFWLFQQTRVHWAAYRRLAELSEWERRWGSDRRRREAGLQSLMAEWPHDGFAAEALLRLRARAELPRPDPEDQRAPLLLSAAARQQFAGDLQRLRQLNPLDAVRYDEDRVLAAEFGRLWQELASEEEPVGDRTLLRLSEVARKIRLPEVALVLRRIVVARRGFYAPADMAPMQDLLGQLLPNESVQALMASVESGRLQGIHLTNPPEEPTEILQGMNPLVHPLLAEHAVREYARETLWIEMAGDNVEMRAAHLRQRAIRSSNVGRLADALADLDAALKLQPGQTAWLVDRAVLLSKLGREKEAEAAFAEASQRAPQDEFFRTSLAVYRFGQDRFADAEALFRTAKPGDSNREYSVIFGFLCGARHGAADRVWLRANRLKGKEWPAPIQSYLAGEIDRAGLLAAAQDPSDLRTTEHQCEAFFSLGEMALAAGDRVTAQRELENCVQTGIVGFIEFGLAQIELNRLRPPAPPAKNQVPRES